MRIQVDINPKILVWAREDRFGKKGLIEVAEQIKVDHDSLLRWERDGKSVPFDVLEILAKSYKRQVAIFFLPETPKKTKKIKDFRNLTKTGDGFSPETLLAIRRTERYLEVARELEGRTYWDGQYEWIKSFTGKTEKIREETTRLRDLLDSRSDGKISKNKSEDAFKYWRRKIEEKLGIFVFQFSMPEDEIDGFSYAFEYFPYAIVVNSKRSAVRKIFTLFHELAHILKHDPGACRTDALSLEEKFNLELECNSFAGEFLVPDNSIQIADTADQIYEFAKLFNISGEVYLRRLFDENKISKDNFFYLLDDVRAKSNEFKKRKQQKEKGGPSRVTLSKSTRGKKFFDLVVNATSSNRLSYSKASDLLELKVGSIRV